MSELRFIRYGSRTGYWNSIRPPGQDNPAAKLTAAQVAEIRSLYRGGEISQHALGLQFGVSQTAVSKIVRGARWAQ